MNVAISLPGAVAAAALSTLAWAADPAMAPAAHDSAKPAAMKAGQHDAGSMAMKPGNDATRDWSSIDTNKDHLVSPEEMEAYLKAHPYKAG